MNMSCVNRRYQMGILSWWCIAAPRAIETLNSDEPMDFRAAYGSRPFTPVPVEEPELYLVGYGDLLASVNYYADLEEAQKSGRALPAKPKSLIDLDQCVFFGHTAEDVQHRVVGLQLSAKNRDTLILQLPDRELCLLPQYQVTYRTRFDKHWYLTQDKQPIVITEDRDKPTEARYLANDLILPILCLDFGDFIRLEKDRFKLTCLNWAYKVNLAFLIRLNSSQHIAIDGSFYPYVLESPAGAVDISRREGKGA